MTRDERSEIDVGSGLRGIAVIVTVTGLVGGAAWLLAFVFASILPAVP